MNDTTAELTLEASRGQAQFAYFQLGLSASAIAFAVHETDGKALVDTPWPEGLAVVLWSFSFALGCFGILARHRGLLTNAQYIVATRGVNSGTIAADPELAKALDLAKNVTQTALDKPFSRFQCQLWMLFAGAMAYVAGHIMQMAATPSAHILISAKASHTLPATPRKPLKSR